MSPAELAAPWLAGGVTSVERIKHGLTNQSWLVRGREDAVVVRVSHEAPERLQIDRASEAAVLAAVERAGIGPQVLLCDPGANILVTRYLGPTWTDEDAASDENVVRVAQLLTRLHALEVPAGARRIDLAQIVSGYLADLDAHGEATQIRSPQLRERAYEVAATLEAGARPCLCHTDVHALNLVDNAGLRLLDWEYAGVGEPLLDVASLSVFHRYPAPRRRLLLESYGGAVDDSSWQRLELACWLFDYIRELWLAVLSLRDG